MSSMLRLAAVVLLASQAFGAMVREEHNSMQLESAAAPTQTYKQDCWQKRGNYMSLLQNPGAGIDKFTPFQTVEKDGFLKAQCVKDYMFSFGDKFGDNRHSYKLEKTSGVSIVHYSAHVAKEDRQPMTPKVCFEFCRTVPQMGFFGIVNGRDCYCEPYYKPMESDSSDCDSTCEGDATQFCGGKDKSTVFSMHMCANTAKDLSDAGAKASSIKDAMNAEVETVENLSIDMQHSAENLQKSFGKMGDSASADLFQDAKVFAGDLEHAAEAVKKIAGELDGLSTKAKGITKFTDAAEVTKAEGVVDDIDKMLVKGDAAVAKLDELKNLATAPVASKNASKQYYPVMYFVDKAHEETPQTCGGDVVAKPIVEVDLDQCATACDKLGSNECVGFGYYAGLPRGAPKNLCFLFSKFKTAFYYTGCSAKTDTNSLNFLQSAQASAPYQVKCMAKFSEFEGTTLAPDGSGKCKQCLKKLTKADRCYAGMSQ